MASISPTRTVAELVLERPARARLFERLGLDYCCGGKRPLAAACERRGLDVGTVVAALEALDEQAAPAEDWSHAPLPELAEHIVAVHHARLRSELPRLSGLLEKCVKAHGAERPELADVRETFERLRAELESHTDEEERTLFPAIAAGSGGLGGLIGDLEREHEQAGQLLERLAELTGGYDADTALCNTHRATLDGLRELELDLHEHIHEENNILFPRALAGAA